MSGTLWQKHCKDTRKGERCHGLGCEEVGDVSGYVSVFWHLGSSYPNLLSFMDGQPSP